MVTPTPEPTPFDVAVIGTGFGGLGAAMKLVDEGANIVVFDALKYPGGCASTFSRWGAEYESGATLFSGFAPGQLFHDWMTRHNLNVEFQPLDPLVEFRTPDFTLEIPRSREELLDRLCNLPDAPSDKIRAFFAKQQRVADLLWSLFDEPSLLPPFGLKELATHVGRSPKYLELLPMVAKPLGRVLREFDLHEYTPLLTYLNAICQITIQTNAIDAETPFAFATMDYYFRGTGHIKGGIGELAWALLRHLQANGADTRMADAVTKIEREDGLWRVTSRRSSVLARRVVANVLPQNLVELTGTPTAELDDLTKRVQEGWGAVMLYLQVDNDALSADAHHYEIVADPGIPFEEGNHLFVSMSASDENKSRKGYRTVTISTHLRMTKLMALDQEAQGHLIQEIQDRMRQNLAYFVPEIANHIYIEMTASPRTFERFTRRKHGYVGGIPRVAGWDNYRNFWPREFFPGLYLVGDSVFPGQSTLATAIGGVKTAESLLSSITLQRRQVPHSSLSQSTL